MHTYLARERCRRGWKATATAAPPAAPMLLLFAKRCIILSAMLGISKRNTSGFAIVLRICSPIQDSPVSPPLSWLLLTVALCSIREPFPSVLHSRAMGLSNVGRTARYALPRGSLPTRAASQLIHVARLRGVHDLQITRKPS